MIFLVLAIICSVAIGIIIHYTEQKRMNRMTVMAANYWTAAFLGYILSTPGNFSFSSLEIGLSVAGGITFVLGFLAIMISIHQKGLAIPVTLMRLSVIFPVIISILFWNETLTIPVMIALVLTVTTILLFTLKNSVDETLQHIRENWIPIFMLITIIGCADTLTRALEYYGQKDKFELYLLILFGSAAVITTILMLVQNDRFSPVSLFSGIILGIPNYFTSHFILRALTDIPAVVVFPAFNLGVILLSVIFAVFVLKEKLSLYEKWGIVVAIPAIVLLQLS